MPDPRHVSTDLRTLLVGVLAAGLVVVLVPFPSELLNRTYALHRVEILGWFGPLARLGRVAQAQGTSIRHWLGFAAFSLLSGILFSLLNPSAGLDTTTLATVLGMAAAAFTFSVSWGMAASLYLRRRLEGLDYQLLIVLSALPLAAACVLVSRLVHFQPGYLYGLIAAIVFAKPLSRAQRGSSIAVSATATVLLALAAWFARIPLAGVAAAPHPPFLATAAATFLTALFVLGIEHLVFRLLPLSFMDGDHLRRWSKLAWALLFGAGILGFLHVLLDPAGGYARLADTKRAGLITAIVLFCAFGLFSIAFWAYFRFRRGVSSQSG